MCLALLHLSKLALLQLTASLIPCKSQEVTPSAYASSGTPVTLTWSSANADQVWINTLNRFVDPSGSIQVASQQTTDYSCYGYSAAGGTGAWNLASLTVTPPSSPVATINSSLGTTMSVGQTY